MVFSPRFFGTLRYPVTADRYQVRSIPTLLLFKGGVVVDQVVGALPKGPLKARLEQFV